MKVELSPGEIEEVVERFGFSISAQTKEIAPADRKIYALRDATATVESIPLIVSSILSKKLAVNTDAIVFDVKVGSGAFMKEIERAEELAKGLVEVSNLYGKRAGALITDMNQPLGIFAGNALEVRECHDALRGDIAPDLLEITASLAGALYCLTEKGAFIEGKELAEKIIREGRALKRFVDWVEFLGGNPYPEVKAKRVEVRAPKAGFISKIDGEKLGWLLIEIGGGRRRAEDEIDYSAGFAFYRKIGDFVEEGEVIGEIYFNRGRKEELIEKFLSAYAFSQSEVKRPELIKKCLLNGTCN
jgi:pyrimidine-nucleoside phosphorylase